MTEEQSLKFYLTLVSLNVNSHVWLMALAFDSTAVDPLAPPL